jgi:fructose-bisphosphate aldolase class II
MTPYVYFEVVAGYAEEIGYDRPFVIHGDHLTVKTNKEEEVAATEVFIDHCLKAGYTSFALDASFNEEDDNIAITSRLAKPIVEQGFGLETEVGEIKSVGADAQITTVDEAVTFVEGLKDNGISTELLGINNGSKHGNYLDGEEISIDLERTKECYDAVKKYGVCIAQHGITGTPLHLVGSFADYGIRKGNVGTHWQNIAHQYLPDDLMAEMKTWAESAGKDIKFATKQYFNEINSIPQKYVDTIVEESRKVAIEYFEAFRAVGSAKMLLEKI